MVGQVCIVVRSDTDRLSSCAVAPGTKPCMRCKDTKKFLQQPFSFFVLAVVICIALNIQLTMASSYLNSKRRQHQQFPGQQRMKEKKTF